MMGLKKNDFSLTWLMKKPFIRLAVTWFGNSKLQTNFPNSKVVFFLKNSCSSKAFLGALPSCRVETFHYNKNFMKERKSSRQIEGNSRSHEKACAGTLYYWRGSKSERARLNSQCLFGPSLCLRSLSGSLLSLWTLGTPWLDWGTLFLSLDLLEGRTDLSIISCLWNILRGLCYN